MADTGVGATAGRPSSADSSSAASTGNSSSSSLDGAFLLQLLRNPPQSQQHKPPPISFLPHEILHPHRDPAVAAVGQAFPYSSAPRPFHHHRPSAAPPQDLPPRFSPPANSFPRGGGGGDWRTPPGFPSQFSAGSPPVVNGGGGGFLHNLPAHRQNSNQGRRPPSRPHQTEVVVQRPQQAASFSQNQKRAPPPPKEKRDGNYYSRNHISRANMIEYNPPREESSQQLYTVQREFLTRHGGAGNGDVHGKSQSTQRVNKSQVGVGMRRNNEMFGDTDTERICEEGDASGSRKSGSEDLDDLTDQLDESLALDEDTVETSATRPSNSFRRKDARIDLFRGHYVLGQRARMRRREVECRYNIDSMTPLFLNIYKSLIPADEEKEKQKQLLLTLRNLVNKEWPDAQLHLYGSCANSFGVSKSDIDICLAIDDSKLSKSEILLKLADILQADNLQDVQALTHARVPIVKLMDPATGISCDICINNLLAVANTKLLRDYAQIDERLRQLAFIVKHWAKCRGVNETYRGTLSSYAYVLMCIHYLQQREPAILPCLQEMDSTYVMKFDGVDCSYFDRVDRLRTFGSQNHKSVARLLYGFFHYWAFYHDYTNDVISVRTGRVISKRAKDWTRRIGNDRHLICIEDPFETSHDLGRVVDKFSIKILREEFERASDILQYDANPSVTLFEPYVPRDPPDGLE